MTRKQQIEAAYRKIVGNRRTKGEDDRFTGDGKITVSALKAETGLDDITADERDTAMDAAERNAGDNAGANRDALADASRADTAASQAGRSNDELADRAAAVNEQVAARNEVGVGVLGAGPVVTPRRPGDDPHLTEGTTPDAPERPAPPVDERTDLVSKAAKLNLRLAEIDGSDSWSIEKLREVVAEREEQERVRQETSERLETEANGRASRAKAAQRSVSVRIMKAGDGKISTGVHIAQEGDVKFRRGEITTVPESAAVVYEDRGWVEILNT